MIRKYFARNQLEKQNQTCDHNCLDIYGFQLIARTWRRHNFKGHLLNPPILLSQFQTQFVSIYVFLIAM